MDALAQFIEQALTKPFVLGQWDCGLWLADWYMFKTGKPDPANHLRNTQYRPDELVQKMSEIIERLELIPTPHPERGDIGMIELPAEGQILCMGAICSGTRWMVLSQGRRIAGMRLEHVRKLGAWKVE